MAIGRNEPCPCGSGKKYKKCCLNTAQSVRAAAATASSPAERLELAKAAFAARDFDQARALLKPLLRGKSVAAPVWLLASGIEMQDGQYAPAKRYIENALALQPDNPTYLYNLGTILSLAGEKEEAVAVLRRVITLRPDMYQAVSNLGNTLRDLGRPDEAIACYRAAFRQDVRDLGILGQTLLSMQFFCFNDHEALYEMHCDLGARITSRVAALAAPWRPTQRDARAKLRLGYLSPRFSREILGYFFKPILDHHSRDRFEIYLYSATVRRDDMTDYFKRGADHWTDIRHLSDSAVAQRIADDHIDILVDLGGHTPESRIAAIAAKPAPVQISMLDYFDTTGLPAVDYYVSDPYATPSGGGQRFSEQLLLLDTPRLVYEPPEYAPPVRVRVREAGKEPMVFGSFNRHQKMIPEVIAAWSQLLQSVEGALLVLKGSAFSSADMQEIYRRKFVEHGVDGARITFRGPSPHEEMLRQYADIDIALDTFPYNGGLTSLEALWMGTPIIAMEGERLISRQTAGMLTQLGLSGFVAHTVDEFVAIGSRWAQRREELNALRRSLRGKMAASALTDAAGYTRNLESKLEEVWGRYLAQAG